MSSESNESNWTFCGQTNKTTDSTINLVLKIVYRFEDLVGPPLFVFGIATNLLTLLTLRSTKLKESPYVCLSAVAMADLVALVFVFIMHGLEEQRSKSNYWCEFFISYIFFPLANMAASVGVNAVLVLTIERCVFVKFPLRAPIISTVGKARIHMVAVLIFSALLNTPRFFWYRVGRGPNSLGNATTFNLINNLDAGTETMVAWGLSALHIFIPFSIMLTVNPFLAYQVRLQQKKRRSLGVGSMREMIWTREQVRITVTSIATIFYFMLLCVPSAFSEKRIIFAMLGQDVSDPVLSIIQRISNFLMYIHLSSNFILYTFINTKFFKVFKAMIIQWKVRVCSLFIARYEGRSTRSRVNLKKESSVVIYLLRDTSFSNASKC